MKKTVLIVIRVVCIVGFLVCVGVLGWYWHSDRSDRAVAEALAAAHDAASAEAMEQVRAVAADNADTIGWLRIDGTNINNVVMFWMQNYLIPKSLRLLSVDISVSLQQWYLYRRLLTR